ncbi:alpha/beta hydrolase [Streptomyces sp. NPDC058678]|uniref:alpha/beta hydrolase n=1 Tax=Streptomyces sp. NPDC058678 TaxID=3346595 RepID=UPI003650345C
MTAAVVAPLSAAARPQVPAPAPATLAPVTAATLDETYAANRANAEEASRMAAAHGDRERAAADRAMADPSRDFLSFDGRGSGRATEVFGDLAHADRTAVLVPGSDTSLETYDRFRATAAHLRQELTREGAGADTAVVAWLGYETPGTISATVTTTSRADQAAPRLREFISQLRGIVGGHARVSLVCHSYGSVVCGSAASAAASSASASSASASAASSSATASDLDVDDIALIGSPGVGVDSAAALHTRARVWAGRGSADWVREVPHIKADLFGTTVGFGTDPVSPSFGARVFAAGDGGHSDYFAPGSVALTNLARIVLGETSEVTHA